MLTQFIRYVRPVYKLGTEWYGLQYHLAPTERSARAPGTVACHRPAKVCQKCNKVASLLGSLQSRAAGGPKPELYSDGGVAIRPGKSQGIAG